MQSVLCWAPLSINIKPGGEVWVLGQGWNLKTDTTLLSSGSRAQEKWNLPSILGFGFFFFFFGDLDLADFQNKFETTNSNWHIYNKAIEILMKHEKS